jgi:hypothetical protein
MNYYHTSPEVTPWITVSPPSYGVTGIWILPTLFPSPRPYVFLVQNTLTGTSNVLYTFYIREQQDYLLTTVSIDFTTGKYTTDTNDTFSLNVSPVDSAHIAYNDPYYITITFNRSPLGPVTPANQGDQYIFKLNATTGIEVVFGRNNGVVINTEQPTPYNLGNNITYNNQCNQTIERRVPIVYIYGQTTVDDANYLSDFKFVIKDKYKYYDCKNIVKNKKNCSNKCNNCKEHYYPECKLKTTTLYQVSPPMQDVVKGKGCTLRDKLLNYYNKHYLTIGPSFDDFYEQMILYGMLKYILARCIYGDFNIEYLYKNFNKQFFKDLANSRFCGFIEYFDNPDNNIIDYDQYFICGN